MVAIDGVSHTKLGESSKQVLRVCAEIRLV